MRLFLTWLKVWVWASVAYMRRFIRSRYRLWRYRKLHKTGRWCRWFGHDMEVDLVYVLRKGYRVRARCRKCGRVWM